MTKIDLILLNFNEVRRRSIVLWKSLPKSHYYWKPDQTSMTAIEMIRHVLQADYGWNMIINNEDMSNYSTPWENKPYLSVEDELAFAEPFRRVFLRRISQFTDEDLSKVNIIHPGNFKEKPLGQYLLRLCYHESVHAGQFLSYLRSMNLDRPNIWD